MSSIFREHQVSGAFTASINVVQKARLHWAEERWRFIRWRKKIFT